jgi:hypothetical protein
VHANLLISGALGSFFAMAQSGQHIQKERDAISQKENRVSGLPRRAPLSGIEEGRTWVPKRAEAFFERCARPDIIAIEGDVFLAERGDVGKEFIRNDLAVRAQLCMSIQ